MFPTLGGRAFCYAVRSSGAIYQVKYLALTLCQILYAMLKHIFLNRLLISIYFDYFIIYLSLSFYFILFNI